MGENHPGVIETPLTDRDRAERQVAWARDRLHLAHAAVEEAERDYKAALASLELRRVGGSR
jgi:hypothetical protein